MRFTKTAIALALFAAAAQAQTPVPPGAPPSATPPVPPASGSPVAPPKMPRVPPAPVADAPAPPPAPPADPLAGFGWFAQLAGACWKGDHPDGKTSDTQCFQLQFKRVIRGTIKVESTADGTARTVFEGDSVFAVDPAAPTKVSYTQWGSTGNYTVGEMFVEGEMLRFQTRPAEGGESRVRFAWRKVDDNSFRVSRERRESGVWKEAFAVVYKRVR
jgi:hypothetical protein